MIPLRSGQIVPGYQQVEINSLQHFKSTALLQQLLWRFQFSEADIAAYRNRWGYWLKPKTGRQC